MTIRPRDRVAIAAIAVLALLGGYYLLALKPERQKATKLSASITKEQQTLAQAEQSYHAGIAAQNELKTNQGQWSALQLAVPAQANIPALLRTLDRTAHSAGVQMQAISLTNSTAGATTSQSSPPASGTAVASAVPLQLTFKGGYVQMNRLVTRLSRFVSVAGSRISASGPLLTIDSVQLAEPPTLTVQMNASIYQLSTSATPTSGG